MATTTIGDILKGKYPAKANARKVADWIIKSGGNKDGLLYLEAQKLKYNEDNDQECAFRQRRFFFYLSGCELPDCYLTYHMATDKLTLFLPPIDADDVVWSGLPLSPEQALEQYDVDEAYYSDRVNPSLAASDIPTTVHAIDKQISDHITFLNFKEKNFALLKPAVEICRVIKSDYEIALIKHANLVSTEAHVAVMRAVKSATNERELEGIFLKECIARGCRNQAYSSIVASGTSAATLHYVKNNAFLSEKLNLLLDAGAELACYASDITRTFPISGTFSKESREIYDIVLQMQLECIDMLKEGIIWDDVHAHAHRIAITGLLKLGILKGDPEDIFKSRTSVAFFPHGLGHYLGMDTHDSGGNANYSDEDSMFRYLRVRGTLPAGSVITVEPGIYFCEFIIEPALKDPVKSKFIDADVLKKYWEVGGVRIEDNVLVTKDGHTNLTPTPKKVADMEKIMNG
ncbi:putative Xaa-Pro aminopeptidase pepP [Microthyrium microscopicum]|uniref:Xaa-Pro aminopeptidase n=1 Tax=Microthyrium microscopicum TaxID=703497 RepID=A0A6A6US32_9PEZI|nr:putative Xaa-Pro aminopeptidase pepP [Microthyrium microscopicum]